MYVVQLETSQPAERRKVYFSADQCDEDKSNAEPDCKNCMANVHNYVAVLQRIIPWRSFLARRYKGTIWTVLHSA